MVDLFPACALHLLQGGAGVVVPTFVVPEDMAVRVGHPDQLGDVVGKGPEAFLVFAERFESELAFSDVLDDADVAQRAGLEVLDSGDGHMNPDARTIALEDNVFRNEDFGGGLREERGLTHRCEGGPPGR